MCSACAVFGFDRCPRCSPQPVYVPARERKGRGRSLGQQAREDRVKVLTKRLKAAQRTIRLCSRAAQRALLKG